LTVAREAGQRRRGPGVAGRSGSPLEAATSLHSWKDPPSPRPEGRRVGLDFTSLVLATETEFNIHIPDDEASRLETPGLLHAWLCRRLWEIPVTCPTQRAFHRLRRELVRRGVARGEVRPSGAVADLVPPGRTAWREL